MKRMGTHLKRLVALALVALAATMSLGLAGCGESQEQEDPTLSLDEYVIVDGMKVAVDSIETNQILDTAQGVYTCITVSYTNRGGSAITLNPANWSIEDADGTLHQAGDVAGVPDELARGTELPGMQTLKTKIYIKQGDEAPVRVCYDPDAEKYAVVKWAID